MSTIPKEFISELLTRIDIVEIVGLRLHLKKNGSNYSACCPFHSEKTPSFTVSQTKQFYHCFGCGIHGDAIDFLMRFEKVDFTDAIEALANHAGVEVPKTVTSINKSPEFNDLYTTLGKVSKHYQQFLRNAASAITYLKKRGLSGLICKNFGIGFAPNDWNNLKTLISHKDIETHLITTGMLIKKDEKKIYARFRNRIIFPIRDRRGKIIGFGGRSLGDELPKYLNSPETPLFHKGNELYGLYEAKNTNKTLEQIIVVEGYMDVIALAQHGITWAVATLGTAITPKQIQILFRNANNILFCFDGDNAGKKAAWRALENALPVMREGIEVNFLFLPENEDPDSLVRKEGAAAFLQRINNNLTISEFFFQHILENAELSTIDGRAKAANNAKIILQKMPNGIFKQLMLNKLAELISINVTELTQFDYHTEPQPVAQLPQNSTQVNLFSNPIQYAICLLLHHPKLALTIENSEKITEINNSDSNLLIALINFLKSQHNIKIGAILECWRNRPEQLSLLHKLAVQDPIIPDSGLDSEFSGVLRILHLQSKESRIQELLHNAATRGLTDDEKQMLQKLIRESKK